MSYAEILRERKESLGTMLSLRYPVWVWVIETIEQRRQTFSRTFGLNYLLRPRGWAAP